MMQNSTAGMNMSDRSPFFAGTGQKSAERMRSRVSVRRRGWRTPMSLLLAGVLAVSCGDEGTNGGASRDMSRMRGASSREAAAIPVRVATVERGDISTFLLHTTTIEAEKEVDVVAKVAGQVVSLPAEEGMTVKKGQVLAQLDEAELKIELTQARVRMETDKAAFERAKDMLDKQLIAEENFDAAKFQYENSKAAYEAAKLRVEYTTIRSPIAGVVTARLIELGQRVNVNQPLFQVADFSPLRARIYVPEKDMAKVFEGQRVIITVDALPGATFDGVVKMISPIVDPTNGTAKVTIDINNSKSALKPGMFATANITTESHKNTLIIPKKALLLESQTDQVFVYDQGVARKRTLELGFTSGDRVEVLSGLAEGELVVTVGQEGLREGLPLRIPGEESPRMTDAGTPEAARRPDTSATAPGRDTSQRGERQQRRPSGEMQPAPARPVASSPDPAAAPLPEKLAAIEEAFMQNRFMKRAYERKLEEDPDVATDPAKKMAFFREAVQSMEDRVLQNPMAQDAYMKAVEKDPEIETDLLKKLEFFQGMFRRMRRRD